MRPKIVAIRLDPVKGGQEVGLLAQTGRGARYRYRSVVVLRDKAGNDDFRKRRAGAVESLLANLA